MGTWLPRRLSLKGRVEVCTVYVFPLIHYRLAVLPLTQARRLSLHQSLGRPKAKGRWSVDRSAFNVHAIVVWVSLIWRATDLLKNLHTWADPSRGEAVWTRKASRILASSQIPRLKFDVSWEAKHCFSANVVRPFVTFLGPVTFHSLGKNYIGN